MTDAATEQLRARLRERRVAHVLPDCPEAGHGRLWAMPSGRYHCSHAAHLRSDGDGRMMFEAGEVEG